MQKLGQHFLKNKAVLQKIVDALTLVDGDRIIEIGPGHGELTAPLAQAMRNNHGKIFCIEKDHALISALEAFATQENSVEVAAGSSMSERARMTIIEGDALKILPEIIKSKILSKKGSAYKIVGNIPYYITGKLLRTISELEHKPERTVLLIQKEVAERICATPPDMNRLAASVQFWAKAEIVAQVPRSDFSPAPDVDSAVIVLDAKPRGTNDLDPALYYKAVHAIFAQPRKTLLNNLSTAAGKTIKKDDVATQMKKNGIHADARPQDLSIGQIASLASMNLGE